MNTNTRKTKAQEVTEKYFKNWVRDDQLVRYYELGVLTEEQYNWAVAEKIRRNEEAQKDKDVADTENTADDDNLTNNTDSQTEIIE